jgi:hypothetical protein
MATLRDVIKGVLDADALDLLVWAQWYVSKNMTCKECLTTRAKMSKTPPSCYKCGLPCAKLKKQFGFEGDSRNEKI